MFSFFQLIIPSNPIATSAKHCGGSLLKKPENSKTRSKTLSIPSNSTYCRSKLLSHFLNKSEINRFLHTSNHYDAITKEELIILAKVRQVRENKGNKTSSIHSVKKMQENLTNKARERKVPSSRIGRIMSFGGKFLPCF